MRNSLGQKDAQSCVKSAVTTAGLTLGTEETKPLEFISTDMTAEITAGDDAGKTGEVQPKHPDPRGRDAVRRAPGGVQEGTEQACQPSGRRTRIRSMIRTTLGEWRTETGPRGPGPVRGATTARPSLVIQGQPAPDTEDRLRTRINWKSRRRTGGQRDGIGERYLLVILVHVPVGEPLSAEPALVRLVLAVYHLVGAHLVQPLERLVTNLTVIGPSLCGTGGERLVGTQRKEPTEKQPRLRGLLMETSTRT